MRVGIVCEGSTDFAVLRVVCREVLRAGGPVITLLQPSVDALEKRAPGTPGAGWHGVRTFLRQTATTLAAAPLDVIVVHVDADVRSLHEVKRHLVPTTDPEALGPLCDHVKSWMPAGVPETVVIALPREQTEAWLCAVATNRSAVETIPDPASALRDAGHLRERRGAMDKRPEAYAALAEQLVPLLRDRRRLAKVPELERFVGKLAARTKVVRTGRRSG